MNVIKNIERLLLDRQYIQAKSLIETLDEPSKTVWTGWLVVYDEGLNIGEQYCLQVLQAEPSNSAVWSILGWIYWEQDHPQKSVCGV